jgi:hypothetical protein
VDDLFKIGRLAKWCLFVHVFIITHFSQTVNQTAKAPKGYRVMRLA